MADLIKIYAIAILVSTTIFACSVNDKSYYDLGSVNNCDATENSCTVSGQGYIIELKLGPTVIPLQKFPVELAIANIDEVAIPADVTVDFQMIDMDMGINRYKLTVSGKNMWSGTAILPVCVASRMDWIAIVEFTVQNRRYRAVFPFHTDRS